MTAPNDAPAKPLIFCPRSIRAWQANAKTQTRRLARPLPERDDWKLWQDSQGRWWWYERRPRAGFALFPVRQPYAVGDICWLREGLKRGRFGYVLYTANPLDYLREEDDGLVRKWPSHWKRNRLPAMFMPRWACRHYAKVLAVYPERLQDITDEDAVAEGTLVGICVPTTWYEGKSRNLYSEWWAELHRKPGTQWEDNPWIWKYALEPVDNPQGI